MTPAMPATPIAPAIAASRNQAPKLRVVVSEVTEVTPMIKRFRFEPAGAEPLPPFSGGAHVIVEMQDGATLRRNPYSLMSPPNQTSSYTISVRRDDVGRGGSLFLHRAVRPGHVLTMSRPVNLFPIDWRARRHLLIAGGIGITPFLAQMVQHQIAGSEFELHFAVRGRAHGAYLDLLEASYGDRVHVYCDDRNERIPLDRLLAGQPLGTHLYVCGPQGMMAWVLSAARATGWPEGSLHSERFLAPASGAPYEVTLALSRKTIRVTEHQSMLDAIEAAGVDAPYMCRGGACGECETPVLSCAGTILHNDEFLSAEDKAAGRKIMPCVSRFEGTSLVLQR
ncbi:MAG: oxidoreductase [Chloroflexi bacterium]|nr:oxidoreductase [Chloroflexota bacterium]